MRDIEILPLDVIPSEDFALEVLRRALHENGIVGIKGIPGYKEKVLKFIEAARAFSALPEEVKNRYSPKRTFGELPLGYEKGTERFQRADGSWVIDDLKANYYGLVPDTEQNHWPVEVDLKPPFQELGELMSKMGTRLMEKIGLLGSEINLSGIPRLGRMLYYCKNTESQADNPLWCGSHHDHGLFTALLPAFYFEEGIQVAEPMEAGLFIKTTSDGIFKKVVADDPDVLLFQVGEFAQLASDDAIRATEHRVHKATGSAQRYTMALFFEPQMDLVIHSHSQLAKDARYGGGVSCSYRHWTEASYGRYLVK